MKKIKYIHSISERLLCYMRIIFYGAILALLLPVVYWILTHTGRVKLSDRIQSMLCRIDDMIPF